MLEREVVFPFGENNKIPTKPILMMKRKIG